MRRQFIISLLAAGIVIGTVATVILICRLYDNWNQGRALVNRMEASVPALRGEILDADGAVLATSNIAYDAHLDCTVCKDSAVWEGKAGALASRLAEFRPERDSSEWSWLFQEGRRKGSKYLLIAKDLTDEQLSTLRTFPLFDSPQYQGGGIISRYAVRDYPNGRLGRWATGLFKEGYGAFGGIESSCDSLLSGTDGRKVILTGSFEGREIRKEKVLKPMREGLTIHSTLSLEGLRAADSLLRKTLTTYNAIDEGCLILMNHHGAIRTMCNVSRNKLTGELTEQDNLAVCAVLDSRNVASLLKLGKNISSLAVFADEIVTDCFGKVMSPMAVLALYSSLADGRNWSVPHLARAAGERGRNPRQLSCYQSALLMTPSSSEIQELMKLTVGKKSGSMIVRMDEGRGPGRQADVYLGEIQWKGAVCSVICAYYGAGGDTRIPDADAARHTVERLSEILNR